VFYVTDGSANIYTVDPEDFKVTKTQVIKLDGEPVFELNELEYYDEEIWANIYYDHNIVRIDPEAGTVTSVIHLQGLEGPGEYGSWEGGEVLNGIAIWDDKIS
jgi:glutamine cyclotransferase